MKPSATYLAAALAWLLLPGAAAAQNTFTCDGKMYYFSDKGTSVKLVYIDNYTGSSPSSKVVCTLPATIGTDVNALAAHPLDGYLYFMEKNNAGDKGRIWRLSSTCQTNVTCPFSTTPAIPWSIVGTFDHLGRYWIISAADNTLRAYDINTCSLAAGPYNLSAYNLSNDIVFNTRDCYLYTGEIRIDLSGNVSALPPGFKIQGAGTAMGVDGHIYSFSNNNADSAELKRKNLGDTTTTSVGFVKPGTASGTDMAAFPCATVDAVPFVFGLSGCAPVTVSFTDSSTGLVTTWLWDFGGGDTTSQRNPVRTYDTAGTYVVRLTVSATSSCLANPTNTDSLVIVVPTVEGNAAPVVNVSCFGGSDGKTFVSASNGTPPYTYTWSTSETTDTIAGLAPGTYYVTVTSQEGCTGTDSVAITQPLAPLAVSGSATNILCNGDSDGVATALPSGGTPGYSYQWSAGGSGSTQTGLSSGTYTVTVTDANGCTSASQVTVTEPPALTLNITPAAVLCSGDSTGSADLSPSGGSPAYSYTWSHGASGQDPAGLAAGTYSVTVTDANGCTATDSVTITEPASRPAVTTAPIGMVSCFGGSDGSGGAAASGGSPGYIFSWTGGQTTDTVSGLPAGTYTVTVTDANGCPDTASITITGPASPLGTAATGSNLACNGDQDGTAGVRASGGTPGYIWLWNTGGADSTLTGLTAGTYTVTVTDANGCTSTDTADVTQPPAISLAADPDTAVCGSITISIGVQAGGGTAPYSYNWDDAASSVTPAITVSPSGATTYRVTVTDAAGCSASEEVTIDATPMPVADFSVELAPSCEGLTGTLADLSTDGMDYLWDFGDDNTSGEARPVHEFIYGNTYSITLTVSNGACADTAVQTVQVLDFGDYNGDIIIPNIFTPNGDGINDVFRIEVNGNLDLCTSLKMIFNRWGNKIYEPPLGKLSWDGHTNAGVEVPEGVYYFIIQIKDREVAGWVHLIR